jgi:hypothetical protein
MADKTGAIAGASSPRKYGWKVGDQIPLRGTDLSGHVHVQPARHLRRREAGTDTSTFFFTSTT